MGLEAVELIMDVEDTFGISIPDEMAGEMLTVGDLTTFVLLQYQLRQREMPGGCPTAAAFRSFRKELAARANVPLRMIRPAARLADIVPSGLTKKSWRELAAAANLLAAAANLQARGLFRTKFAEPKLTVRQIIHRFSPASMFKSNGAVDQAGIFARLRSIIAEQLNIDVDKVQINSRFAQDLGV